MKHFFVSVLLVALFLNKQQALGQDPYNLNIIPPSPNAAALGKYGNVPVSLYTGTYNFSVPIYKYKVPGRDFSLAVSLDYHASGVRVDEMASNVGQGWVLSAGGAISRTMVGLPDDSEHGFMRSGEFDPTTDALNEINRGVKDSEPDAFNYNFNGRAGKFHINKTIYGGQVVMEEQSGLKIEYFTLNSVEPILQMFIITAEDGVKYTFSEKETTIFRSTYLGTRSYTSAWMLTRIDFPYSLKPIVFSYEGFSTRYNSGISQTGRFWLDYSIGPVSDGMNNNPPSPPQDDVSSPKLSQTDVVSKRLLNINFPTNETISFVYNTNRSDLTGDKKLDFIYLDENKTKGFKLEHDYFSERLFLQKIYAVSGASWNNPYQFEYIEGVPKRLSLSQDYWGFNNGKANNSLIPQLELSELGYFSLYGQRMSPPTILMNDGNRLPDSNSVKKGLLSKVTYPAGGITSFKYESNISGENQTSPYPYLKEKSMYLSGSEENNTSSFELGKGGSVNAVNFTFKFDNFPHGLDTRYKFTFQIKSLDNLITYASSLFNYSPTSQQVVKKNNVGMGPGTYKVVWSSTYPGVLEDPFTFTLKWTDVVVDTVNTTNKLVGGVRIKEISDEDGRGGINKRVFKYLKEDGLSSSGMMTYKPVFSYKLTEKNAAITSTYLVRSSFSGQALAEVQGAPIAYNRVVEVFKGGQLSNGENQYYYTVPSSPFVGSVYPFPLLAYTPWLNGLLKEKRVFDNQNQLKRKEQYDYLTIISAEEVIGQKVGPEINSETHSFRKLAYSEYYLFSGYALKQQFRTTDYFSVSDSISTVTGYTYEPRYEMTHYQPNVIRENWGTGKGKQAIYLYPKDYSPTGFIGDMLSRHIISSPVEVLNTNEKNEVLSGVINQYQVNNGSLKEKEFRLESNVPIPASQFKYSNQSIGTGPFNSSTRQSFMADSRYVTKVNFLKYDADGKILNYSPPQGTQQSFLWSYQGKYPVVSITNADYGLIESLLSGSAGINAFNNSAPASKSDIYDFIAPLLNDLRLKDAQFTVYTYDRLNGLTSQTDPRGISTYYEYDEFQRLKYIKDHNLDIVKAFDYHYKPYN